MNPIVFVWALFALAALTWPGCGTVSAYAREEQRCEDAERVIVTRGGSTQALDEEDLAWERRRCAEALAAVRGSR